MGESFSQSSIWIRCLGVRENDSHASEREHLRVAFERMRKSIEPFVAAAHNDCRGLTVHDLTHLDALWTTASLIAGDSFDLTPAEAFVLGGSILLHDAGMAVASYKGRLAEIRESPEWMDAVATVRLAQTLSDADEAEIFAQADFNAIRKLHARKCEDLATSYVTLPDSDDRIYLLDDSVLRAQYGLLIGQIAHSHHWDTERLLELPGSIGSLPQFPQEWTVDPVKVAALLRCADAAHIDADRAPSILFSLVDPKGVSKSHWSFQNKISQIQVIDRKIKVTSTTPFRKSDSSAWWLCYETSQMIDKELNACHALLKSSDRQPFYVEGVLGVESPVYFSNFVRTDKWRPVKANIVASNPTHLAEMLGGQRLYGSDPFAPMRELIQNSADAIRARRIVSNKGKDWGSITVEITEAKDKSLTVSIQDNGIGMSERVLTHALLDFGNSYWSSSRMQEEFPGLMSKGYRPVGQFGIGFFSVFMIGENVEITSRHYENGADDARILEIRSIRDRPILDVPDKRSLDLDIVTSVKFKLKDNGNYGDTITKQVGNSQDFYSFWMDSISSYLRQLVCTLDIDFHLKCPSPEKSFSHPFNWHEQSKEDIVKSICGKDNLSLREKKFSEVFDFIKSESGEVLGFAGLPVTSDDESPLRRNRTQSIPSLLSNNGFTISGRPSSRARILSHSRADIETDTPLYAGIMSGMVLDAARSVGRMDVSDEEIAAWSTAQGQTYSKLSLNKIEKLSICHGILKNGGDPKLFPYAFSGGEFINITEFVSKIEKDGQIFLPISLRYSGRIQGIVDLSSDYFLNDINPEVTCACVSEVKISFLDNKECEELKESETTRLLSSEELQMIFSESGMSILRDIIHASWGTAVKAEIRPAKIFAEGHLGPRPGRWVLVISKSDV